MKSKLILNWTNLENISEPLTHLQIKTVASVLTKRGVGNVICPKCNELNLVRDGIFRCVCKFTVNIIDCRCGCGRQLLDRDPHGRLHQHIRGHNSRGQNNPNYGRRGENSQGWKGGRMRQNGYWYILRPNHPKSNSQGYILEHRFIYEEYYHCRLLPWTIIHHHDGNKYNNHISNLIPTTMQGHRKHEGLR